MAGQRAMMEYMVRPFDASELPSVLLQFLDEALAVRVYYTHHV